MANICDNDVLIRGRRIDLFRFYQDQLTNDDGTTGLGHKPFRLIPTNGRSPDFKRKMDDIVRLVDTNKSLGFSETFGLLTGFDDRECDVHSTVTHAEMDNIQTLWLTLETKWGPYNDLWKIISDLYQLEIVNKYYEPGNDLRGEIYLKDGGVVAHYQFKRQVLEDNWSQFSNWLGEEYV